MFFIPLSSFRLILKVLYKVVNLSSILTLLTLDFNSLNFSSVFSWYCKNISCASFIFSAFVVITICLFSHNISSFSPNEFSINSLNSFDIVDIFSFVLFSL